MKCIKCGKEITGDLHKYREGTAALTCDGCLAEAMFNELEEYAAKHGKVEYYIDPQTGERRVRGHVKL